MSLLAWLNPNFWYQLKHFMPHKVNGKWHFIKRDIVLPFHYTPNIEQRYTHIKYDPPVSGKPHSWVLSTGLYRRLAQSMWDHACNRIKPRGNGFGDYVGAHRRKIRYPVYAKNRDPYVWMLFGARSLRMRWARAFGWHVPEQHGPGAGLGIVPRHLDYNNKLTRMTEDDYVDTGVTTFALKMIPTIALRRYFNELPRITAWSYGMDYNKEHMYNHIFKGIDPGNLKIDELLNPSDPKKKAAIQEEKEIRRYLWPEIAPAWEPDYKLKWPFPDDNIYRPTFNRGFNRRFWSRSTW